MQSPWRETNRYVLAGLICLSCISAGASAQEVQREIRGIHLQLAREDVHKQLGEIGSLVRHERKGQEIWQVRDESFSHLIVAFGKNGKLRFVTAVAREDKEAKRVPYGEIGDLEKARQAGDPRLNNFNYEWDIPSSHLGPRALVNARGRDPTFLTTYSLKTIAGD
jgi:hypothetical protein